MSNNFNSISTLWMYLSLSVNIHQSYRFKMNVKLFVDNLGFIRIIRIIQLAITDIRIGISSPNFFLLSLHFSLRLMRCFAGPPWQPRMPRIGPCQVLAATLTLSQPGGADYAHPILVSTPSFESHRRACTANIYNRITMELQAIIVPLLLFAVMFLYL